MEFTPESADGTVELTYTLDASALTGTTIVVFETLYSDGVEIAAHTDINDEAQTITINPKGGLLIQKTSEDGALEGFTFLVEGEGLFRKPSPPMARGRSTSKTWPPASTP